MLERGHLPADDRRMLTGFGIVSATTMVVAYGLEHCDTSISGCAAVNRRD